MDADHDDDRDDDDDAAADLYLEQLQERARRPRRWAGVGPVITAFRMMGAVARGRLLAMAMTQLLVAALAAAEVLLTKSLIEAVQQKPLDIFGRVLPYLLVLVALTAAVGAVMIVQNQTQLLVGELVVRATWERLLRASSTVPLLEFESPAFYDRLQRIIANTLSKPLLVVQGVISLANGLLGSVGLMIVIGALSPVLLPIILLAGIPLYFIARLGSRLDYEFAVAQTPNIRQRVALTDLLTERESAAEVRAFRLAGLIGRRYHALYDDYLGALRIKSRRRVRMALASGLITALVGAGAAVVLLYLVHSHRLSVSSAGAGAVAIILLTGRIEQVFAGASRILDSALFIAELDDFAGPAAVTGVESAGATVEPAPLPFDSIALSGVTFRYPAASTPALLDVDMRIERGKVIAVVGENGSGKTTLSKIIANLYPPDAGRVVWDGVPVASLDPERVARSVAIVMQDFVRYEMSLAENIGVGRPSRIDDEAAIAAAAEAAGVTAIAARLRHGLDTFLSARFPNGVDLSVGQWQRVALARALFRDAPLVIMDEPTAALDVRAEAALFRVIRTLLRDRTVLLVTHRFVTTRMADLIVVLHEGRVVERGTHEELMSLGGRYADMFALQSAPFLRRDGEPPRASGDGQGVTRPRPTAR